MRTVNGQSVFILFVVLTKVSLAYIEVILFRFYPSNDMSNAGFMLHSQGPDKILIDLKYTLTAQENTR